MRNVPQIKVTTFSLCAAVTPKLGNMSKDSVGETHLSNGPLEFATGNPDLCSFDI